MIYINHRKIKKRKGNQMNCRKGKYQMNDKENGKDKVKMK